MAIRSFDLDCQKCSELSKAIRGCEKDIQPYYSNGEMFTRCPVKLIKPQSRLYINLYNSLKALNLSYSGKGLKDEAAKYVQLMLLIENEINKLRGQNAEQK